jgi:hypothetical protein
MSMSINDIAAYQGGSAGKLIPIAEPEPVIDLSPTSVMLSKPVMAHVLANSGIMPFIFIRSVRPVADTENTAPGRVMTSGAAIK